MSQQDRPTSLRRAPRPARDESIDPIDTRPSSDATPSPAEASDSPAAAEAVAPEPPAAPARSTSQPKSAATAPAARGRRKEPTVQLGARISIDVDAILSGAVDSGRAPSIRAALEEAIRKTWG